ncbi:MAG: tripartite tricarboxylate transporter substrate-binding protein, partial [Pseudolabrys sp.]
AGRGIAAVNRTNTKGRPSGRPFFFMRGQVLYARPSRDRRHVDFYFSGFPAAIPHVKAHNVKMPAMSSVKRTSAAPDGPTVAVAAGVKDFDSTLWMGYFAPKDPPQPIIDKLNKTINAVITQPDIKAKLATAGAEVTPMSVAQFSNFVLNESSKYLRVIKEVGAASDEVTQRAEMAREPDLPGFLA